MRFLNEGSMHAHEILRLPPLHDEVGRASPRKLARRYWVGQTFQTRNRCCRHLGMMVRKLNYLVLFDSLAQSKIERLDAAFERDYRRCSLLI